MIRHQSDAPRGDRRKAEAFTLVEVLTVLVVILILAGLVISTAGYVQKKGATSRAEAEISAMEAALESYKADNGVYPTNASTNNGAFVLYQALSGDGDDKLGGSIPSDGTPETNRKVYMEFKPAMISSNKIIDPFGAPYQYLQPGSNNVATFDLYSLGGKGASTNDSYAWIKNW